MTTEHPPKLIFYVAPDGRDTWTGKLPAISPDGTDGPFGTLERARDALRSLKQRGPLPEGGVTVSLRGGVYPITRSFHLTAQDSGTEQTPVIYRPYQGETVRLIGGRILSDCEPAGGPEILQRLSPEASQHVVRYDIEAHGINDFGRFVSRGFGRPISPAHMELFFQHRRMEVARWPNNDFVTIKAAAEALPEGDGHGGPIGKIEAGFFYDGDRPARWKSLDDVWIHGYWAWDWANSYERIASFDPETGRIKTYPPYGLYGIKAGQRFYFLNILEELDQPGEYYMDRTTGILYFWPPDPVSASEVAVSTLEGPMIQMEDVSHITIQGLTLEYTRGNGIQISGGEDVHVAGCTICNIGNYAIVIDGGTGHSVQSCNIYYTGDGGIQINGGDRTTLTPARHEVVNNHIHHIGEWSRCYRPAVMVGGVGVYIAHNLIHDGPHSAIQLNGNEHVIELNHIHHVCQETGDVGAFYMGRDWTERGNIIRYNFFHDTQGYGMGSMAVYLDDCSSGTTVFGNVFYRCTRAAFIGGGRNNIVENNIFVECDPAVWIDGRGLDPKPVWQDMVYTTMKERLEAINPHQPPYGVRYPELTELDRYYQDNRGIPPEGNLVIRNISCGGQWVKIHWQADPGMVTLQDNLVDQDPLFVDASGMNFQIRPDSPAYKLGFKRIPVEEIGLYVNEYRSLV